MAGSMLVNGSAFVVRRSSFAVRRSTFVVRRSMFVVRRSRLATILVVAFVAAGFGRSLHAADPPLPELTQPVNDFAHAVDNASADEIDRMSRALQAKTGDVA